MDNRDAQDVASAGWTGLRTIEKTLPSRAYFDPAHHQHELERIWYRDWVYLCRVDTLAGPLDFRVFDIGTQQVLLLRDEAGELRAFHNTCRHRGAALCAEAEGTLRTRRITCPYHAWTYDLRGRLIGIPTSGRPVPVKLEDYPLHAVQLRQWGGFVYVSLAAEPPPFRPFFDEDLDCLARWPLAELKVGATHLWTVKCNWKIFWDNYSECLHCPGVHPGLSRMVPIYSRGILGEQDDPNWQEYADRTDPKYKGGLREGAATWSLDGRTSGHEFPGLSEADRAAGYAYITILPAQYLAAHVDYIRSVRIRPIGPEATEVYAEWLFPEAALADPDFDLRNTVQFSIDFLDEDAAVCELNHRGLHSIRHQEGMLMPEEIHVHRFQDWVRARL